MKNIVLALDFDGTLYPIEKFDSEQLLALESIKYKKSNEDEIKVFIDHDKRGMLLPSQFNALYESFLSGVDEKSVYDAIRHIFTYFDKKNLESLKRILSLDYIRPAILSCGSDVLINAFLEEAGLYYDFHILAKEFTKTGGKLDHLVYHVKHIDDKKSELIRLKEKYDALSVAVGDGPTDKSMLEASDYPFIITWGKKRDNFGFEEIENFDELEKKIEEIASTISLC